MIATVADRDAVVSPTVNGFTLIADKEFESHDEQRIKSISIEISRGLGCAAVLVTEYDDDILSYLLIEAGSVTDNYNSDPDYFDFAGQQNPPRGPQGGNAERLCSALNCSAAVAEVEGVLHAREVELSAPKRHSELAKALHIPTFSVGFDYSAARTGELPEALNESDLVFTSNK